MRKVTANTKFPMPGHTGSGDVLGTLQKPPPLPQTSRVGGQTSKHSTTRKQRHSLGYRLWTLTPRMIVAGCFGAVLFFAATTGGANVRTVEPIAPKIVSLIRHAGLGIEQIHVSGYRYARDKDIFAAMPQGDPATFFSFDIFQAQEALKAISWVKDVAISRQFPGQLNIRITERTPAFLWWASDIARPKLVDESGRVLGPVPKKFDTTTLIKLQGLGADKGGSELLALLSRHAYLRQNLRVAERVADRRWTLHFNNRLIVYLPAENADATLRREDVKILLSGVSTLANKIVDLRIPGRVYVKNRSGVGYRAG